MAFLVAYCLGDDDWDVVVVDRMVIPSRVEVRDVLGRVLPPYSRLETREGIPKEEAVRLANQLRGMPRESRYALFRERAPTLRLRHTLKPDPLAYASRRGGSPGQGGIA